MVGTWPYYVVFGLTSLIMIGCAIATAWSLIARRCCVSSAQRDRMLPLLKNERELAAICNLIACLLRPLWFLNLGGTEASSASIYSKLAADAVLLRLPQCIWITAYLLMILVWRSIILSADGRMVGWRFRAALAAAAIAINLISLPLAIAARAEPGAPPYLHLLGNALVSIAVVALLLGGLYTLWVLRQRILTLEAEIAEETAGASAPMAAAHEDEAKIKSVFSAIHSTYRHVFWALALAAVLIVAVALAATPAFQPQDHPWPYFGFVCAIHIVVESGTAVHIALLTFPRTAQEQQGDGMGAAAGTGAGFAEGESSGHNPYGRGSSSFLYEEEEQDDLGLLVEE